MILSLVPTQQIQTVHCSQGDTALRVWEFELYADGIIEPYGSASLVCSNGAEIPLTESDGKLICECTSELSAKTGLFPCKIKIQDGDEVLYSSLFQLHCEVIA